MSSTPTCWLLYAAVRRAWARTVGLGACGCGRKITAMVHGYSCTSIVDRSHHWVRWDWLWQRHCEEVRSALHLFWEDERIIIIFESCRFS